MNRNNIKRALIACFLIFMSNVFFINAGRITEEELRHKGLKALTPEETSKLEKNKINKVHANKLALARANEQRQKRGLRPITKPQLNKKELEGELGQDRGSATASIEETNAVVLSSIAQVDNSTMASFPVVGNQSSQASCVAWATTYYMMSHEVCLSLGCDNKNSQAKVFSPRWTYNMINSGVDGGSYFSDAFSLIQNHGAAQLSELPYNVYDYRSWDLNSEHWRSAINSRMSPVSSMTVNTDAGITNLKQLLANGHVTVIGTYINSWVFNTVKANPNSASNPFVGQYVVTHLNGTAGAHAMTVVGFDDNIWTDINANGIVESAELGAFKIANSWGSGWRNGGYAWASYDSFRSVSALAGFAPTGRVQLTQSSGSYLSTYVPYQPKLLAKVTLSHLTRQQLSLQFGSSSTSTQTPQAYWYPNALVNKGGAYSFDGLAAEVEGTFYFDISSLLTSSIDQQLFYLMFADNASGSTLAVKSFQLVDPSVDNTLYAANNVPMYVDAASGRLIAGNYTPDTVAPSIPDQLASNLTVKRVGKKIVTTVNLSWRASTDNVGVTKYLIYRNGMKISESTSLTYADTTTSAGKSYSYQVVAVDAVGNQSALSVALIVVR